MCFVTFVTGGAGDWAGVRAEAGPRKFEEEMGAEEEEEKAPEQRDNEEGAGFFERARLGSVAGGRAGFGSVTETKSETEASTEAEVRRP